MVDLTKVPSSEMTTLVFEGKKAIVAAWLALWLTVMGLWKTGELVWSIAQRFL